MPGKLATAYLNANQHISPSHFETISRIQDEHWNAIQLFAKAAGVPNPFSRRNDIGWLDGNYNDKAERDGWVSHGDSWQINYGKQSCWHHKHVVVKEGAEPVNLTVISLDSGWSPLRFMIASPSNNAIRPGEIDNIIAEAAWTPETVVSLLREFIGEQQLNFQLSAYLTDIAKKENGDDDN